MYGLRKINKDGIHHGFQWPLEVGAIVECPDWNPEPECGGGLHMLPEAIGNYTLLDGDYWCVIEFDESQMIRIDWQKAKVPECKIVYLSESPAGLKDFFDFSKFDSECAYYWARNIGDQDIMRDRITDSEYAYYWARNIGDQDIMRDRITDSEYVYRWALNVGDKEIMRDRITDSEYAYKWARDVGDKDIMRERITDPVWLSEFKQFFEED